MAKWKYSDGWQPIETAPRDGTYIILLMDDSAIEGRWIDCKNYNNGDWVIVNMNSHGCGCCGGTDPSPTHWMPLPPPPTT